MININLIFLFFAGIAFLGFILNALFDRIKIASILPLMIIGLAIGPVLRLVSVGQSSIIPQLTPFITAIAVSFILFDVGLNMNVVSLQRVIARTSAFTVSLVAATAVVLALPAFFIFHWTALESIIFALAVAGPSSVIVPTLMRVTSISPDLKTALLYESISSDIFTLMIPVVLAGFLLAYNVTPTVVISTLFYAVFGSLILGSVSALFWLYILNRFSEHSKSYRWMLTITMVVATYGLAQQLLLNGAITVFVFGIMLSNIGYSAVKQDGAHTPTFVEKYLVIGKGIGHIKRYQGEIVFFVSTFFFVYIGLLFNLSQLNLGVVIAAVLMSMIILMVRYLFIPMIRPYMSKDSEGYKPDRSVALFNVARGMTPAIVATVPLSLGITIPYFLNQIFLIILFTNLITTAGMLLTYRPKRQLRKEQRQLQGRRQPRAAPSSA